MNKKLKEVLIDNTPNNDAYNNCYKAILDEIQSPLHKKIRRLQQIKVLVKEKMSEDYICTEIQEVIETLIQII